jgi:hypothetical protein
MTRDQLDAVLSEIAATDAGAPPVSAELSREVDAGGPIETRRPMRQLAFAAAASLAYMAALVVLFKLRRDLAHLPRMWLVAYLAAWFSGFLAILALVLIPPRGSVMPRWRMAAVFAVAAGAAFTTGGLALARSVPGLSTMYEPTVGTVLSHSYYCLTMGMVNAALPIGLGVLALRGAAPVRSGWVAAALGAAGGCLGGLFLHLHCPITERFHLGLIHGGVVVLAAAVAALVLARRLRP